MRGKHFLAAMLFSITVIPKSKASTTSLKLPKASEAQGVSTVKIPSKDDSRPAHVYGQIRLEGMQYLTPVPDAPRLTYSQLLSARLTILKETGWVDMTLDTSAGTFFSRGQNHWIVHEAYLASKGESFKTFVGRKKKDWSELDHRWNLGLWQPYMTIDALRPEEEGLSGVFLDYNKKDWEILGMVTPLFIPSMSADIREEGGGLVSDSRWYRAPSRNYDFNNRINTISYKLDIPEQAKLVNNGGAAFLGRLGNKDKGPWVVTSVGYLPVNELILKRQAFKQTSQDKVDVTVSPAVTYHHIQSMDVGYAFNSVKVSASYLQDSPETKMPDPEWSIQDLKPLKIYSGAVDFSLANFMTKTIAVQLGYMKVNGGGIEDILSDGRPDDFTLYDARLKFTNAAMMRLEGQLASILNRPLVTRFKYLYDFDQRGSLVNTEFLYYPNQKWAVVMGGDALGVRDENYKPSSFLNQYRANDRFYGGMTYVF